MRRTCLLFLKQLQHRFNNHGGLRAFQDNIIRTCLQCLLSYAWIFITGKKNEFNAEKIIVLPYSAAKINAGKPWELIVNNSNHRFFPENKFKAVRSIFCGKRMKRFFGSESSKAGRPLADFYAGFQQSVFTGSIPFEKCVPMFLDFPALFRGKFNKKKIRSRPEKMLHSRFPNPAKTTDNIMALEFGNSFFHSFHLRISQPYFFQQRFHHGMTGICR